MKRTLSIAAVLAALAVPGIAEAHPSVISGPGTANTNTVITIGVGHGCSQTVGGNLDTSAIEIEINANNTADPTGVRAMPSAFGPATVTRDGSNNVTSIKWTKPDTDVRGIDDNYYTFQLRLKPPNAPFTRAFYRVLQTCKSQDLNTTIVTDWSALPGETGEPAAALVVLPARVPGWNKYVLGSQTHITDADFELYFKDAQIVWHNTSAYSANANIAAAIPTTTGVTALTGGLHPDYEIWVRY